jgi:hypothetical protein
MSFKLFEQIIQMISKGERSDPTRTGGSGHAISIVPTFVPTQQTDGHTCAQPATW